MLYSQWRATRNGKTNTLGIKHRRKENDYSIQNTETCNRRRFEGPWSVLVFICCLHIFRVLQVHAPGEAYTAVTQLNLTKPTREPPATCQIRL